MHPAGDRYPARRSRPGDSLANMSESPRPTTLGELRASGWASTSVKDEVRRNAIARIQAVMSDAPVDDLSVLEIFTQQPTAAGLEGGCDNERVPP